MNSLRAEGLAFVQSHFDECVDLIEQLCAIPAPSNHEEARAAFCKEYMESVGASPVTIDPALNVVFPYHITPGKPFTVLMAHTDTVFPDLEPFSVTRHDGYLYAPGIGDDTANLAILLLMVKYVCQANLPTESGILFVADSGEEGLGNLKGAREIMKNCSGLVSRFISLDGGYRRLTTKAVGSSRYKVEVKTEGGHSFGDFGNRNAIHLLSSLITGLYSMKVPKDGNSKTTYNVGMIEGGTSVNSIAQQASMLYEYRSDSRFCLEEMSRFFHAAVDMYRSMGIDVSVTVVGERPCGADVPQDKQEALTALIQDIIESHDLPRPDTGSGSTDCNIPLSMGIPSVCFGGYIGKGGHTREECILEESLRTGLSIIAQLVENL